MRSQDSISERLEALTDDVVASLARVANLNLPAERVPAVAQRLRELHELAAVVESVDIGMMAPSGVFDPTWPEVPRT